MSIFGKSGRSRYDEGDQMMHGGDGYLNVSKEGGWSIFDEMDADEEWSDKYDWERPQRSSHREEEWEEDSWLEKAQKAVFEFLFGEDHWY